MWSTVWSTDIARSLGDRVESELSSTVMIIKREMGIKICSMAVWGKGASAGPHTSIV